MRQIIYIHGGVSFQNNDDFCKYLQASEYKPFYQKKKWINRLVKQTEGTFEIFHPEMPNKYNANYAAWKIWFEKIFPFLNNEECILIGHSFGGIFLLKYLTEEGFPKNISQLYLISSVSNSKIEYLGDFEINLNKISSIENLSENIFLYHSTDDQEVPYDNTLEIHKYLPKAKLITFTDRGHVRQETFPELLENIVG